MRDVARAAAVSITTVSHVINDTRFVSDDIRARVLAAAEALRFVPSALARSLKTNRTRTIGVIVPNSSNPYFAEVVRAVEDGCFDANFNLILCNSDDDASKEAKYLRVLAERQVDGLLVMSSRGERRHEEILRDRRLPIVLVDREVEGLAADVVEVDHELGGLLAARHLLELGHREIACITGPLELSSARQRLEGFRRALREAGLRPDRKREVVADFSGAGGFAAMQALLAAKRRPTAVFACNDLMAFGAMSAASSAGLAIPQQLSVIGFDDIALAALASPPLSTVAQPKAELGALAAHMLLARIGGGPASLRVERIEPTLCLRRSTAPPAAAAAKSPLGRR